MKTKSSLLRPIGALLVLLLFVAFPSSPTWANCGQCDDVVFELVPGGGRQLSVELICEHPTGADIYYTTNGVDPTHDAGGNPGPSTGKCASGTQFPIPYNTTIHIKAIADKGYCWSDSANITQVHQHNPEL